jgi:hypothetical protein
MHPIIGKHIGVFVGAAVEVVDLREVELDVVAPDTIGLRRRKVSRESLGSDSYGSCFNSYVVVLVQVPKSGLQLVPQ